MDTPPQDSWDLRIAQLEAALATSQTALAQALERIAQLERRLKLDSTNSKNGLQAAKRLAAYFEFYNEQRPHQSLRNQRPGHIWRMSTSS
jgi:hypothetical protein